MRARLLAAARRGLPPAVLCAAAAQQQPQPAAASPATATTTTATTICDRLAGPTPEHSACALLHFQQAARRPHPPSAAQPPPTPPAGGTPYATTTQASLRAAAASEVQAAEAAAASYASWSRAADAHGWAGADGEQGLVFVVADSLSIDWGPHCARPLGAAGFRFGRKNLRCAKGFCRAWDPVAGEGPKELVANAGLDGCNGGDSRTALAYMRHLATSTAPTSPQDERVLAPTRVPSRLTGTKADVIVLNAGLWDVKTDGSGKRAVPLEEYARNVREMVRLARQELGAAGATVVWVSTTPVDDHKHNVVFAQSWKRFDADVRRYNAVAAAVMAEERVPVVDLYSFTADLLGTAAGRDHGHMVQPASAAQGAYIARAILQLTPAISGPRGR